MIYYKPYNDKPGEQVTCYLCKHEDCQVYKFAQEGVVKGIQAMLYAKGCKNGKENNEH